MPRHSRWFLVGLLLLCAPAMGAPPDATQLVTSFERLLSSGSRQVVVVWAPPEFWQEILKQVADPGHSPPPANFLAQLDPYQLVLVADMRLAPDGSLSFTDEGALVGSVSLEDGHGARLSPIPPSEVAPDATALIQAIRPLFQKLLGQFGEHLAVVAFRSADEHGQRFADPVKDGSLTIHVGDTTVRFDLPLASLLPAMIDPRTGGSFPGNYRFNPFTGDKLQRAADK